MNPIVHKHNEYKTLGALTLCWLNLYAYIGNEPIATSTRSNFASQVHALNACTLHAIAQCSEAPCMLGHLAS